MKVIILAGGFGTRLSEETSDKPKPMVLLGEKPILWHLMNIYAHYGFKDFIIATGYKHHIIDEWVGSLESNFTISTLFTGETTATFGRIAQCINDFQLRDKFMVTYGDGLGNINIHDLINSHLAKRKIVTVTAVRPPARFGVMEIEGDEVIHFGEKNQADAGWINGGFFVIEPKIFNYLHSASTSLESEILPQLARDRELGAFKHFGFWQPMDTLRERNILSELSKMSTPPWLL
jgi:glucose-1-phosphate cytidylyltransferase